MIWQTLVNIIFNCFFFADDANMYCHIKDVADKNNLKRGIDSFVNWRDKWQVKVNK